MEGFRHQVAVDIVVPAQTARMLAERPQSTQVSTRVVVTPRGLNILVFSRRGTRASRPFGAFSIHLHSPAVDEATIDQIAWDPAAHGSEDEVRAAINALAGWPIARINGVSASRA